MKLYAAAVLILFSIQYVENYKILAIFPQQSRSHFVMYERLLKELAERGHEVDVVSHFPQKKPIPRYLLNKNRLQYSLLNSFRYNDLSVKGTVPILVNNMSLSLIKDISITHTMYFTTSIAGYELCEILFENSVLKNLKNTTKKYDVLLTEIFGTDCMLGFAHIFQIPVVTMTSSVNLPWSSDRFGNPDNPSYIPNYFVPYLSKMTLPQRIYNTITLIVTKIG